MNDGLVEMTWQKHLLTVAYLKFKNRFLGNKINRHFQKDFDPVERLQDSEHFHPKNSCYFLPLYSWIMSLVWDPPLP